MAGLVGKQAAELLFMKVLTNLLMKVKWKFEIPN
jgi:hypothetical protein